MKTLSNYINEAYASVEAPKWVRTSTSDKLDKNELDVDGQEHEFDYVDLGLPSRTLWATANVGSIKPEDPGFLFQWGRVDGYRYGFNHHAFKMADQNLKDSGIFYIPLSRSRKEYVNGDTLELTDDAARDNMGGKWHMPTFEQLKELLKYTTHKIEKRGKTTGLLFTSKENNKQMFIPYGGYWSDTFGAKYYDYNDALKLWSSDMYTGDNYTDEENTTAFLLRDDEITNDYRSLACSVRGVFMK